MVRGTLILCFATLVALTIVRSECAGPSFCHGIDCPKYKLTEEAEGYEVREYESSKWISTVVKGFHFLRAQRIGFNRLFSYIQGANESKKRIPMTAPVRMMVTPSGGPYCKTEFVVSFFVPFKYTDNIPAPTSKELYIEITPAKTVYVRSFGGFMRENTMIVQAEELNKLLTGKGIHVETNDYFACTYDSPFRLWNRHNEVWFFGKGNSASSSTKSVV